jgi:hypothetical protein
MMMAKTRLLNNNDDDDDDDDSDRAVVILLYFPPRSVGRQRSCLLVEGREAACGAPIHS